MQTGARDAADDLAQKTCLRALSKADQYTPGTHLDRWLFTMARRLWLNEVRGNSVRKGHGLIAVDDIEIPDPRPGIEVNILAHQVFDLITRLPEGQRLAVLSVYVEGFSYKDAAALLDVPIGTIMSRLATARRTIAQLVADRDEEGIQRKTDSR